MSTTGNKEGWAEGRTGEETHPAGWGEGAVDIKKTYRVFDGTGLKGGVDAGSFSHFYRSRTPGIREETMMVQGEKGAVSDNQLERI